MIVHISDASPRQCSSVFATDSHLIIGEKREAAAAGAGEGRGERRVRAWTFLKVAIYILGEISD